MKIIKVTPENIDMFNKELKTPSLIAFVKIYSDGCSHCKNLEPKWDKLEKEMENDKMEGLLASLSVNDLDDADCDTKTVGVPTLRVYQGGRRIMDYEGKRETKDMKMFFKNLLKTKKGGRRKKKKRNKKGGNYKFVNYKKFYNYLKNIDDAALKIDPEEEDASLADNYTYKYINSGIVKNEPLGYKEARDDDTYRFDFWLNDNMIHTFDSRFGEEVLFKIHSSEAPQPGGGQRKTKKRTKKRRNKKRRKRGGQICFTKKCRDEKKRNKEAKKNKLVKQEAENLKYNLAWQVCYDKNSSKADYNSCVNKIVGNSPSNEDAKLMSEVTNILNQKKSDKVIKLNPAPGMHRKSRGGRKTRKKRSRKTNSRKKRQTRKKRKSRRK